MSLPSIDNIDIFKVTDRVLLVHQKKAKGNFSICDGLVVLPKEGRNSFTIVLDLNIEPKYIKKIVKAWGPIYNFVCTHGHMDHIAHLHTWEEYGAKIHAPHPEAKMVLDLNNFYVGYQYDEIFDFEVIEQFGDFNGYRKCKEVTSFNPSTTLKFEDFKLKTISFSGHSKGHVGFLLPGEKILHVSCLGFDLSEPGKNGFGPWYGFKECSISQYIKDIDLAEIFYDKNATFLTSSHSYIVKKPDVCPFNYMRNKINQNQQKVDKALNSLNIEEEKMEETVKKMLEMDIFFPKKKMSGFLLDIYSYWETNIIQKHIRRSKAFF